MCVYLLFLCQVLFLGGPIRKHFYNDENIMYIKHLHTLPVFFFCSVFACMSEN